LQYLCGIVREMGGEVFVRDCSYLGFPSYYVYVPGMSDLDFVYDDGRDFINFMRIIRRQHTALSLPTADMGDIRELACALRDYLDTSVSFAITPQTLFLLNTSPVLQAMDIRCFAAYVFGCAGMFADAARQMNAYLAEGKQGGGVPGAGEPCGGVPGDGVPDGSIPRVITGRDTACRSLQREHYALALYWIERAKHTPLENIGSLLTNLFGARMADKCMEVVDNQAVFYRNQWPACFACDECQMRKDCHYSLLIEKIVPLQRLYMENLPDQQALRSILFMG